MSKQREPQVGDVWEYQNGKKVHIIMVDEETVESFAISGGSAWSGTFQKDEFQKQHKYLGHSKANINDLFQTENEE